MSRLRLLTLCLVLVAVAALAYLRFESNDIALDKADPRSRGIPTLDVVDGEPIPDVAAVYRMPALIESSRWFTEHTKRHRALLKDFQCDILVVPVQVEEMAFDRPTRLLMSGDLARALSNEKNCVTDPFVVENALGESSRGYGNVDIDSLAAGIKAQVVLRTFAGHDKVGHVRVTLQVDRWNESKHAFARDRQKSFTDLYYSFTESPYQQFHAHLPAMLDAVGLPHFTWPAVKGAIPDAMPASPAQTANLRGSPTESAMNLMLLGMLAPMQDRRVAERLFAKAYLALQEIEGDDAVARMRARAMLHLGGRPYALVEAAALKGAEADGLRAIANGDSQGAHAALNDIRDPWDYAFLSLEIFDLELAYRNRADALVEKIPETFAPAWRALVSMRTTDGDSWTQPDPVRLKESLDETFPLKGETLKELVTGNLIAGDIKGEGFATLAARHVRQLLDEQPRTFCCASFSTAVRPLDVLVLYEARAETAPVRQAYFYGEIQGDPQHALATLKSYDDIIGGRPDAETVRANAEWSLQSVGTPADAEDHQKKMRDAAWMAVMTDPAQDLTPLSALWYLEQPPSGRSAWGIVVALSNDFPVHGDWPYPNVLEAELQFSTSNMAAMQNLVIHADAARRQTLIAELDHRFVGNPDAVVLRLDYPVAGHPVSTDDVKKAIASDTENWNLYSRLASLYISEGRYHDASELAQSYPPFHKNMSRTVAYTNNAAEIADALNSVGAIEDARPLLKIAAGYGNGASEGARSQAKLYLLDDRLAEAATTLLADAQRYESRQDFRDFLCLLFAAGKSQEAWQGFNQLIVKLPGPPLWRAALVGHRRDNIGRNDLRQWLQDEAQKLALQKGDDTLANHALAEQLIDRGPPPDDFAEFIKDFTGPSGVFAERVAKNYMTYFGVREGRGPSGPGQYGAQRQQGNVVNGEAPSRQYLFALAYSSLRHGKFDEASRQFDALTQIYDTESFRTWGFVLPYFAFAAAQSDDSVGLERYFDTHPVPDDEWGWQLSKAVFDAIHDRPQDAEKRLDIAFRHRPERDSWPTDTAYQYAEICIWLFEKTGDKRYAERALGWARKHVQIEPAQAWAYALIARYSDSATERAAMLPKALYLDPQSFWATATPKEAQTIALESLKKHKPFDPRTNAGPIQHL